MDESPTPEQLAALREAHNLSQPEAAELCGRSLRQWQYYESGQLPMPGIIWDGLRYRLARRTIQGT